MTPHEFISKWKAVQLSERSACQQHFLDLCELLGQPKPAAADPEGAWYTFERGVHKTDGGQGWADVWMRGHFGWEYKGKHKDLKAAYRQLQLYREDLENPPLLVVWDLDRFEVHTNFTGTVKQVHAFNLDGLAEAKNIAVLRKLFSDPESLRPGETTATITEEAAEQFARLADYLRERGIAADRAAHFLMKLTFCMFGEDIGLLPEKVFSTVLDGARRDPARLTARLQGLFAAMSRGGDFGAVEIPWFNGGLFADSEVIDLLPLEIAELAKVNQFDWGSVEPSIFGTLFERSLDPAKRTQIGAHYTSRQDIVTLVEPVVMVPLKREWQAVREKCDSLWEKIKGTRPVKGKPPKPRRDHDRLLLDFVERLAHVTILDPACGSGNFLYVAINLLLDLEKEVIAYGATRGVPLLPQVRPTQLSGIEINPYAQELAQVVIWIGYLQWMHYNGFLPPRDPILAPIESIRRMDAILDLGDPANPTEPEWPEAEFVVGNPPFLGYSKLRASLGHEYVEALFGLYNGRVSNQADLCCYWYEKGRSMIANGTARRVGLLATQAIRGGKNREILNTIKQSGDIFFSESDREWVLDGANVHVSMVAFDDGTETQRSLDGQRVARINSNLTSQSDITQARRLSENQSISFVGGFKFGAFELDEQCALALIREPNLTTKPNSEVVRPWINGLDVLRRPRRKWIVDFGVDRSLDDAALFDAPLAYVREHVKPERDKMRRATRRDRWWLHGEAAGRLRHATRDLPRFLVTPRVAKHRVFAWAEPATLVDGQLIVIATSQDWFFGLLHSRLHEAWARAQGTQVRERESGFRYTPTTCFETFPFPELTDAHRQSIGDAARELDQLRTSWLNPTEWSKEVVLEFPGSADGPWARYVNRPNARGIGTVRYPRRVARDAETAEKLAKRTLTNLYNQRPQWLALAHQKLDAAVFAAYGWDPGMGDEEILAGLLGLNRERAEG